ncbi:unnamed protein product [Cyclocybe aegerita]|uniref:Uncharacterized protein n=1 Tax=Cyclocybe aegerita TaxID=1973307 RepID=A0A8S0VW15_CYCAE|nr:unnamed protein product [Cyclocybe aegerita]
MSITTPTEGAACKADILASVGKSLRCVANDRYVRDTEAINTSVLQDLLPKGRFKTICVNSLGRANRLRFAHLSNSTDLHTSISYFQTAISLAPDTDIVKPTYLNNLSGAVQTQFTRLWRKADIDNSTAFLNKAIRLLADDHPFKPAFLSNLGESYLKRHNKRRDIESINLSILANKQAIALTPENHARKPIRLLHLGKAYLTRFQDHTKERAHLKEAMLTIYEVVSLIPNGHPFKVECLTWLGICTRNLFDAFRMVAGLEKAINAYKRAVMSPSGEPAFRYEVGFLWAHTARIRHGPSQQAIDAYSATLGPLAELAFLSACQTASGGGRDDGGWV